MKQKGLPAQTGFAPIILIVLLAIVGIGAFVFYKQLTPINQSILPSRTPYFTNASPTPTGTIMLSEFREPGSPPFKIDFPQGWIEEYHGNGFNKDKNMEFKILINGFGDYGMPSCKYTNTAITIDGMQAQKDILPFCKNTDRSNVEESQCTSANCMYIVSTDICIDNNLKMLPSRDCTGRDRNYYFQFALTCNNYNIGETYKQECSQTFDQIMSTFKFLRNATEELNEIVKCCSSGITWGKVETTREYDGQFNGHLINGNDNAQKNSGFDREKMMSLGWTVEPNFAADGAGGSHDGFRREIREKTQYLILSSQYDFREKTTDYSIFLSDLY